MGMIVKDCEVGRALPCLYGLAGTLAHTCVICCFASFAGSRTSERKGGFLPSFLLFHALHVDPPERARHQSRSQ